MRYLLVQVLAYGVDIGTFIALVSSGVCGPLVANLAGKIPAGILAFLAHRSFTFRKQDSKRLHREALKYAVLLALNAPISTLLLKGLLVVHVPATRAKILADILSVGLSFTLTKYVVFERVRLTDQSRVDRPMPREKQ